MRKKLIRIALMILGIGAGYSFLPALWATFHVHNPWLANAPMDMLIGLIAFTLLSFLLVDPFDRIIDRIEKNLLHQQTDSLISEVIAIILALILGFLITTPLTRSHSLFVNAFLPIAILILFGYLGFVVGRSRTLEFRNVFNRKKKEKNSPDGTVLERKAGQNFYHYKLLDTNILIDGRIYDLAKTGFLEGTLVVPNFVLYELQYIADSGDSIKRVRGRRGLDILNKLRAEKIVPIEMYDGDFDDIQEVDSKLIKLAKLMDAEIITNDYNLNKVSEFQNVRVLNINQLAKSLKPRVIPGEKLQVTIIKNGTERQQGVAYLDDGTMIVVEDGKFFMNKMVEVEVTSAIQTDAGRMIFAKLAHSKRELNEKSDN